jgi:hypothetical protein
MSLVAYQVSDEGDFGDREAVLVFAPTVEKAKHFAWDNSRFECDSIDDLTVERFSDCDFLLREDRKETYIESDSATLREAGFYSEGDYQCAECERYTMGDEFPICEHCDRCEECGCVCEVAK